MGDETIYNDVYLNKEEAEGVGGVERVLPVGWVMKQNIMKFHAPPLG